MEQIFSRARGLAHRPEHRPGLPRHPGHDLVIQEGLLKPSATAIKAKYYELFRGKGGEGEEEEMGGEEEAQGQPGSSEDES